MGIEFNKTSVYVEYEDSWSGGRLELRDVDVNFSTISVPALIQVHFGKTSRVFIEAGIYHDWLSWFNNAGRYYRDSIPSETVSESHTRILSGHGPVVGGGIKIPIANYQLIIKGEYKYDLSFESVGTQSYRSRYVRILVGVSF